MRRPVVNAAFGLGLFAVACEAAAVAVPVETASNADSGLLLLIAYIALALVMSFLCSVAEAVLLSITPSYIESLREQRPRHAEKLKRLRQTRVDRSLAAILTMNTIAHTVGAIGAGAQASIVFGSASVGVFSALMTLMVLFLSEIIPKTLGAVYWPRLVRVVALYIRGLILLLFPLVWASEFLTQMLARNRETHTMSRDEFMAMAGLGAETGALREHESKMIRNLFRFSSLKITDIMTPRTVVAALPESLTIAEAQERVSQGAFSRYPMYGKDLDEITGVVLKDEILLATDADAQESLCELRRDILTVPASMSLPRLLEFLLDRRLHIAVVVDEYGSTKGLVTLEDVLETLLGMEIVDEMDDVADMQALARRQWRKRVRALGLDLDAVEVADAPSSDG